MNEVSQRASGRAADASRARRTPRPARIVMQVLWPAFLVAVVAEGIFFSMIDPQELHVVARYLHDSRTAAYTLAFFVFWVLLACASGITWYLSDGAQAADGGPEVG